MKPIFHFIIGLTLALSLSGCGGKQPKPEQVKAFLMASLPAWLSVSEVKSIEYEKGDTPDQLNGKATLTLTNEADLYAPDLLTRAAATERVSALKQQAETEQVKLDDLEAPVFVNQTPKGATWTVTVSFSATKQYPEKKWWQVDRQPWWFLDVDSMEPSLSGVLLNGLGLGGKPYVINGEEATKEVLQSYEEDVRAAAEQIAAAQAVTKATRDVFRQMFELGVTWDGTAFKPDPKDKRISRWNGKYRMTCAYTEAGAADGADELICSIEDPERPGKINKLRMTLLIHGKNVKLNGGVMPGSSIDGITSDTDATFGFDYPPENPLLWFKGRESVLIFRKVPDVEPEPPPPVVVQPPPAPAAAQQNSAPAVAQQQSAPAAAQQNSAPVETPQAPKVETQAPAVVQQQPAPPPAPAVPLLPMYYPGNFPNGKVYPQPDLEKLVGKNFNNEWVYGSFILKSKAGNIFTYRTYRKPSKVLGVDVPGMEGSTTVNVEYPNGVVPRLNPGDIITAERNAPLELQSVTKGGDGNLTVSARNRQRLD